jgi:carbonic anhydrase/acetyltransferase-like protein (isoleucine patch superfamily)
MQARFGPDVDVANAVYVDDTVRLFGKVRAGVGTSFWPYVVGRSEMYEIVIGEYTNIQDHVMMHVGYGTPTIVGAHCSITHHVTLHGCTVGDNCLIGINATLMDGCVIGDNSIVAGHTIVSERVVIPPNSIVAGVPGKVKKTRDNYVENKLNAYLYHRNAQAYAIGEHRAWSDPEIMRGYFAERERLQNEVRGV